jgi:3-hydroxybutyryl-CoA dehydratase
MRDKPRACKSINDVKIGDRISVAYRISDDDLSKFAELSGDWNPVHFDDDYARGSMFGERIAHGMISVAKFSGIFGMDLPGLGCLWENQQVSFLAPVFLDREYVATAEVTAVDRRRITLSTRVEAADGSLVLDGTATVIPISEVARKRLSERFALPSE